MLSRYSHFFFFEMKMHTESTMKKKLILVYLMQNLIQLIDQNNSLLIRKNKIFIVMTMLIRALHAGHCIEKNWSTFGNSKL